MTFFRQTSLNSFVYNNYYNIIYSEHLFPEKTLGHLPEGWSVSPQRRIDMTAKDELLNYILSLSEDKIDKIIDRLPQLIAAVEETSLPLHQK